MNTHEWYCVSFRSRFIYLKKEIDLPTLPIFRPKGQTSPLFLRPDREWMFLYVSTHQKYFQTVQQHSRKFGSKTYRPMRCFDSFDKLWCECQSTSSIDRSHALRQCTCFGFKTWRELYVFDSYISRTPLEFKEFLVHNVTLLMRKIIPGGRLLMG